MKVIKEGLGNLPMVKRITCKLCSAVLEITPKDCERAEGSFNFSIKCPSCKKVCIFHTREVGPLFWLNMNVYK